MSTVDGETSQLEEDLSQWKGSSQGDFSNRSLTDLDMDSVVQEAIIKRRCSSLWLHDNVLTSERAQILTDSIRNNYTLQELFIDGNQLSDTGAQTLSLILNYSALIAFDFITIE